MRNFIFVLMLLALPASALAQEVIVEEIDLGEYLELLQADVRQQRAELMGQAMELATTDEAAKFWPIYREYEIEADKLSTERNVVIKRYAETFMSMNDETANEIIETVFTIDQQQLQLKKIYFERMKSELGAAKAARFVQIDNQLEMMIRLQSADRQSARDDDPAADRLAVAPRKVGAVTPRPFRWQRGGPVAVVLLAAFLLATPALAVPAPPLFQEESEEESQEQSQEEAQQQAEEAARERAAAEAAAREEQVDEGQEQAPPPQERIFDPVAAQLSPGTADELVTLAGSRIIGEFKELKGAQVKFKDPATGDIYVKWELVRTVRSSRFFEVALRDGSKFYGLIVGTDDGRLFVGAGDSFTEVPRSDVVEVTRIRERFWDRFKGRSASASGIASRAASTSGSASTSRAISAT